MWLTHTLDKGAGRVKGGANSADICVVHTELLRVESTEVQSCNAFVRGAFVTLSSDFSNDFGE